MAGHIEPRYKKPKKPGGRPVVSYRVVIPSAPERGAKPIIKYADTKKEAEALLDEMRDWVKLGFVPDTKLTVAKLLDRWLAEHVAAKCKPKTAYPYASIVKRHLKPRLGSLKALSLRPAAIAGAWADMREAGYSDSVIDHCYDVLRAALQWAVGAELLLRNPAAVDVARPPVARYEKRPTIGAAKMLGLVNAAESDADLSMIVLLATATGGRRGELMALRPADVELAHRYVKVDGQTVEGATRSRRAASATSMTSGSSSGGTAGRLTAPTPSAPRPPSPCRRRACPGPRRASRGRCAATWAAT